MQKLFTQELLNKITASKIIAVLVVENTDDMIPLTEALLKGGIDSFELTLRTPNALDCIRLVKEQFPEITLGAGTVLTTQDVCNVKEAGADFAVAPGFNAKIVAKAKEVNLPFAPGVCTPSEIEGAVELGCRLLKYFPAETMGGVKHLNSMVAPYKHLGLSFIPLGGLNLNNELTYMNESLVAAIGGSWIAKADLIASKNWEQITKNALEAKQLLNS